MNILVLQHAEAEHPGIFRSFLDEDGHSWTTVTCIATTSCPYQWRGMMRSGCLVGRWMSGRKRKSLAGC